MASPGGAVKATCGAGAGFARALHMSNDPSDRQQRLAQALRANLRRRKGQARDRADSPDEAPSPASTETAGSATD